MCQYRGGLIGKHFKTISQVMAFVVYDLVPREVLDAWLVIGRLTVLLWHTEIEDMSVYVVCLRVLIITNFWLIYLPIARTRNLYQRLSQCYLPMQPQYINIKAQVPFFSPSSFLHSSIWPCSSLLYRTLRGIQCYLPCSINIQ